MWTIRRDGAGRVVARFQGRLTDEDGESSAAAFVQELGSTPADVVFDVREMEGYETSARRAWQHALWPRRAQLTSLVVVGGNAVVRMGASMLALALGIQARVVDELP